VRRGGGSSIVDSAEGRISFFKKKKQKTSVY
jgi:hypothetical protein